jgi:hypothetical protein
MRMVSDHGQFAMAIAAATPTAQPTAPPADTAPRHALTSESDPLGRESSSCSSMSALAAEERNVHSYPAAQGCPAQRLPRETSARRRHGTRGMAGS